MRHIHLSADHLRALFGESAQLEVIRPLSQPGQFLSDKRVDLVTPKGAITNVAVLGPIRAQTQVEISRTDCFALGLKDTPVRMSGDLEGTSGITLRASNKEITIQSGVIIARRHIHVNPIGAKKHGLTDGQVVSLRFEGERGGVLENVVVRVNGEFATAAHIDSDEANAMGFNGGYVEIIQAKTRE